MSTLTEILLVPGTRPKVVADCARLVDEEVDSKGGLSGLAIKGAYMVVKAVKPGFIPEAIDHMLDDFVRRLEPFHTEAQQKNEPIGPFLSGRASLVADSLLSISDERARPCPQPDREEGLRKIAPDRKEERRGRDPARWSAGRKYASSSSPSPVS